MAADRTPGGQFAKGSSGNKKGRPPKRKLNPAIPAQLRRGAFAIAARDVTLKDKQGNQIETVSLFEANVLTLGREGAKNDRVAAKAFIDMIMRLAEIDLMRNLAVRKYVRENDELAEEAAALREKLHPTSGVVVRPSLLWDSIALDDDPDDHDAADRGDAE